MIVLDTSSIIALVNADDPDHAQVGGALLSEPPPWIVPAGILTEIAYMLESIGQNALAAFLTDIEVRAYTLDCGEEDMSRIRQLVARYQDLPLGFSDTCVIACAERNGGRDLTLDLRDFGVVAREGRTTVVPGGV